mmetsp:Transcript_122171/g.340544  ORF Transcript_122171/g.340544 Transcript_122171/m.340544 type:complete len:233 (-) Transcript_122171:150-848(-)
MAWMPPAKPYYVQAEQEPDGQRRYGNASSPSKPPPAHMQAAASPQMRDVLVDAAATAAVGLARSGVNRVKAGFFEVQGYVQENPHSVRALSLVVALALLACSVLVVVNLFEVVYHPLQYLFAFYNSIFAGVIVIIEGNPVWFKSFGDLQAKLFRNVAILASRTGRALFYFYVGSINLLMLPSSWLWKLIYLAIGGALCVVGVLSLLSRWGCLCRFEASPSGDSSSSSNSESE